MDNSLRADWLAEQSNLHFCKLGSLSAKVASAQKIGQVSAHVELEKLAVGGGLLRGIRNLGRKASEMFTGPSAATRATKSLRGPGQAAQRAAPQPAAVRQMPPTQSPGGVNPLARTMPMQAPTGAAPTRAMPAAGRGQAAPAQVPAPPPGLNLPQQAPFLNRQPLPAPSFPATQGELAQQMQKLRSAGVDPAQAERLRQAFGHKALRGTNTSTPVGHTGKIRTSFEGMATAGGSGAGQRIPLYMPKMSAHELNSVILDVIQRSMPSNGPLLKTASQRATLNDEGILKVASESSYWNSQQGNLHLAFLAGAYDESPEMAWELAKNAGLYKEAIDLSGVGKFIGRLAGGAKNVATAPVRGGEKAISGVKSWWGKGGQNPFERATQAGREGATKAKQTGSQFVENVRTGYGQATGKIAPGGQFAATADDAMGFAKPTGGRFVVRPQSGWKSSTVTPGDALGGTGGSSGLQNFMAGKTPARPTGGVPASPGSGGAPYRSSSRVPPAPTPPSQPAAAAATKPAATGQAGPDYVSDLLNKPTPTPAPGMQPLPKFQTAGGGPIPKAPGGPAISSEGVIDIGALQPKNQIPTAPGGKTAPKTQKKTETPAETPKAPPAETSVPAAPTEAPPGFWDRSFGRTARHIGLAGAIGVPVMGVAGLGAAQSFLQQSPNPYQYGMAAPQSWNQSWQM